MTARGEVVGRHSAITERRLRDGDRAHARIEERPAMLEEKRALLEVLGDGVAALQSLDDLGPEQNREAMRKMDEVLARYMELKKEIECDARG